LVDEDRTEFQLTCEEKSYRITNRPKEGSDDSANISWSPGSCGEVVITVFISCNRQCVQREGIFAIGNTASAVEEVTALPIPKYYRGQAGLLSFIEDFRSGSHTFERKDFASSQAPVDGRKPEDTLRTYGIDKMTVFYQVDAPLNLKKLMTLLPSASVPPTLLK
jgi:hypothetical protein